VYGTTLNESDIDKSADSDDYLPCDNISTSGVNIPETHGHDNRDEFPTYQVDDDNCDVFDQIKDLKRKHPNKLLAAYLNINSFRYKFCHIQELLVNNTVDVLFLAETKIDGTFCDAQFTIDNYHFWRKDRTAHGGGLAVYVTYVRSDLPCDRKNKLEFQCIESISVEIKIGSDKWLITGVYRPQTINEKDFNNDFIKTCDQITTNYDNFILLGDMNYDMLVSEKSSALTNMCDIFDLHNLVKNPTCFTKQAAPSLNDVILTNTPKQCMNILNFNCGISDVYNFISVQFKGNVQQRKHVFKNYRSFKKISEENFISDLEKN